MLQFNKNIVLRGFFMGYLVDNFIAIDRALNTLCGGNIDATISARCGYFARRGRSYWAMCEKIIDFTFRPIDGDNHCYKAYKYEIRTSNGHKFESGSDLFRGMLIIFILLSCIPLMVVFRLPKVNKAVNRSRKP